MLMFADSAATVSALAAAAAQAGRAVEVLVEIGGGRAGARDDAAVAAILDAVREQDSERARVAMQFHLGQARHRLVDRDRD